VVKWRGHPHRLIEQLHLLQALGVDRLGGDTQIDVLGSQAAGHVLGRRPVEFDLDGGMSALVSRQRPGEGEEGLQRQPHGAHTLAGGLGDGSPARLELAQGAFDVIAEEPARVIQPEPAAAADTHRLPPPPDSRHQPPSSTEQWTAT
jgi:hypothetical protein